MISMLLFTIPLQQADAVEPRGIESRDSRRAVVALQSVQPQVEAAPGRERRETRDELLL